MTAPSRTLVILRIAEGGMGYIELIARREGSFTRLFAQKRLHPPFRTDPGFTRMFLDEARVAGLVQHPNVTATLEVGQDAEGPFLLMEYVEGLTVAQIIEGLMPREQLIPLSVCVNIVAQAARGLHAAHELVGTDGKTLGLVHRDISPQNLLIGYDGLVKVADFGIAKAAGNVEQTMVGVLKGNVGYMAPEYLRFMTLDRRSDLFALGIVLYELMARQRLYGGEDTAFIARRILEEPAPDIFELRDVPPELSELLFSMLAKERDARPANALEVASRLDAVALELMHVEVPLDLSQFLQTEFRTVRQARRDRIDQALSTDLPDEAMPPSARKRRRFRPWMWALGAVAAAIPLTLFAVRRTERAAQYEMGAAALWSGGWHTCARHDLELWCWGNNEKGQLNGTNRTYLSPLAVPFGSLGELAFGEYHACSRREDASIACWGRNVLYEAGRLSPRLLRTPEVVEGVSGARQVATGRQHSCALLEDGSVVCWGNNDLGQLGSPASIEGQPPIRVAKLPAAAELYLGGSNSCVKLRAGGLACWGANESGQLLDGTREARWQPAAMPDLEQVKSLSLSNNGIAGSSSIGRGGFMCGLEQRGRVLCWGSNETGQLGDGTRTDRATPTQVVGIEDAVQIALGNVHACALHASGKVSCWGRNEFGAVGDGPMGPSQVRPSPVGVVGIEDAVGISAGAAHSCARTRRGGVLCWGVNNFGQLGDGTDTLRASPHEVVGFP